MSSHLHDALTPELFKFMVDLLIPFPLNQEDCAFLDDDDEHSESKMRARVYPVLVTLSKVGLDDMPNMMTFLPAPSSPDFPEQCLGLQILLDQAPRWLLKSDSIDSRWTNSYFDILSYKLCRSWLALPAGERPDSWARGNVRGEHDGSKPGVSLDYWLRVRRLFSAPQVHHGTREGQDVALAFNEETRRAVDRATGRTDPYRADRASILSDVYAFPRMAREGPPREGLDTASWAFWTLKLSDVHKPIIDRFGRYPYRNSVEGVESTGEEREWIEETGHFGEVKEGVAVRVREDIAAGRWTPLGGE